MPHTGRRTCTAGVVLAALLTGVGLLGAAAQPAQAADQARQHRQYAAWGHTGAPDRVLRRNCHFYRYHYVVTPPTDTWGLETFLVDRRGQTVASGARTSSADPEKGQDSFRICRANTVAGRFHIRAKVSYRDGYDVHEGWLKPSTFTLSRS